MASFEEEGSVVAVIGDLYGSLLPPTTVSATTAWSAFTVTCFTVICCWPFPRWRSSARAKGRARVSIRAP
jgi:hypothetical protein